MWTATVADKSFVSGVLKVKVSFTNGTDSFSEDIDLTGGSLDVLSQKVAGRLNTLNASAALVDTIAVGPVAPFTPEPVDPLVAARRALAQAKEDADLGIIQTTDKAYTEALANAQAAYTAASIDQIVSAQSTVV